MIVTESWLRQHANAGGNAWTSAQLRAIGIRWPAPCGWIGRVIGTHITEAQRLRFEAGRHVFAKSTLKRHRRQQMAETSRPRQAGFTATW